MRQKSVEFCYRWYNSRKFLEDFFYVNLRKKRDKLKGFNFVEWVSITFGYKSSKSNDLEQNFGDFFDYLVSVDFNYGTFILYL